MPWTTFPIIIANIATPCPTTRRLIFATWANPSTSPMVSLRKAGSSSTPASPQPSTGRSSHHRDTMPKYKPLDFRNLGKPDFRDLFNLSDIVATQGRELVEYLPKTMPQQSTSRSPHHRDTTHWNNPLDLSTCATPPLSLISSLHRAGSFSHAHRRQRSPYSDHSFEIALEEARSTF